MRDWLHARLIRSPRTTTAAIVTAACMGLALYVGPDVVKQWQASIAAGGGLASTILLLMRDPGAGE